MTQSTEAAEFRRLHQAPPILVLPNPWDVASARIFERAGFPALASTSAGVAATLGYPDGQRISRREMLEVVARIASAVAVPVTADVEAGYDDPVETARQVWQSGAVGMNLEDMTGDALTDLPRQVDTILAIRGAIPELVLNARTDIFLMGIGEPATRFDRAVERLRAYREAGANCLFAPGVRDAATIERLAAAVSAPLNILAVAGTPPIAELERLGVARVTIGSGAARAALGLVDRIARELRDHGTYGAMTEGALPYAEVNRLLGRHAERGIS